MSEAIDLQPEDFALLRDILRARVPPNVRVFAFGSRVHCTARRYSDLDLALEGDAPLPWELLAGIRDALTESDLTINVDVIDLGAIDPAFRHRIEGSLVPLSLAA